MLLRLALRNLLRQRLRTATTLVAIVAGVAGLILAGGFVQDIYVQLGEATIHSQTGHIQIFRKGYLERGTRQPEKFLIPEPAELSRKIAADPEVKSVSSRLNFAGLLSNGKRDLAIVGEGVEPDKESELGTYLKISSGRQLRSTDQFGLIAGQGVAESLQLKPGDQVTLLASTADGALNSIDFQLVGTFQSFSKDYDARAVRISLPAAQELMLTQGANLLVISLNRTEHTENAFSKISAMIDQIALDASDWRSLSDFYDKTVQMYDKQFAVLEWIILFMVLLSVTNSVNMNTFERQAEFGTMRALGNRPLLLFRLLMIENTILGAMGASVGAVLGITIALLVSMFGIPMPPPPNANIGYDAFIRIVPAIVAKAWLIGLLGTMFAAIVPAMRTIKTPIVEALRQRV